MTFKNRYSVLITRATVTKFRQNYQKKTSIIIALSSYDHGFDKTLSILVSAMVARFRQHTSNVEINLRNKNKWLLSCSYNPKKTSLSNCIAELSKSLDLFATKYECLLFLSDSNAGMEDTSIKTFCSNYNLTSMISKPTCYKNPDKATCIDLILTNCPRSFQNSCVIETGISDFH